MKGFCAVASSSKSVEWATPQDVFDEIHAKYGPFDLDVCATPENAKCAKFYTVHEDGLSRDWLFDGPRCWMNPPYGRGISRWVKKAWDESQRGCTVVCLIPSRTDTAWWHEYVMRGEITFVKGRIVFGEAKAGAPFPSAVVVFHPMEDA